MAGGYCPNAGCKEGGIGKFGGNYCPDCGSRLQQVRKQCLNCGAVTTVKGDRFCIECGAFLMAEAEEKE